MGLDIDDPNLIVTDWDSDSFENWKPTTFDIAETLEELDLITDLVDNIGTEIFEFHSTYGTDWDEIQSEWDDKVTGYSEEDFSEYMKEIFGEDCSGHAADYIDWDRMAEDELGTGDYTVIGDYIFRD